jgi:acyl carrier protein
MERIEQKIKRITQQSFGIRPEQITLESRFKEDLGLDSLDAMELIVELESKFDISIPDEEAVDFKKIADVKKYIEKTKATRLY